jgi:hypothetical protein
VPYAHTQYVASYPPVSPPSQPGPFLALDSPAPVYVPAHQPYTIPPPLGLAPVVDNYECLLLSSIISGGDISEETELLDPSSGAPQLVNVHDDDVFITYLYMPVGVAVGPTPPNKGPFSVVCVYDEPSGRFLSGTGALVVSGFGSALENDVQTDIANSSGYVSTNDQAVTISAATVLPFNGHPRAFDGWWAVPPTVAPDPPVSNRLTNPIGYGGVFLAMYALGAPKLPPVRRGLGSGLSSTVIIYEPGGRVIIIPGDAPGGPIVIGEPELPRTAFNRRAHSWFSRAPGLVFEHTGRLASSWTAPPGDPQAR